MLRPHRFGNGLREHAGLHNDQTDLLRTCRSLSEHSRQIGGHHHSPYSLPRAQTSTNEPTTNECDLDNRSEDGGLLSLSPTRKTLRATNAFVDFVGISWDTVAPIHSATTSIDDYPWTTEPVVDSMDPNGVVSEKGKTPNRDGERLHLSAWVLTTSASRVEKHKRSA